MRTLKLQQQLSSDAFDYLCQVLDMPVVLHARQWQAPRDGLSLSLIKTRAQSPWKPWGCI